MLFIILLSVAHLQSLFLKVLCLMTSMLDYKT